MQTNTLLSEAKHHLDRLTALAAQIHAAGLDNEAATLITAETPDDIANGVAVLAGETDPLNRADYERMVADLGYTPTLNVAAMVNYDLRDAFAAALQTLHQF
ncbi:MAG: hypothetical protein FOGNACKC_06260 [Anaerolineae bacterium]|nr:hypothetical protein [Anaerolineae bacterium]